MPTAIPRRYPRDAPRPFDPVLAARPALLHWLAAPLLALPLLALLPGRPTFPAASGLALATVVAAGCLSHRYESRRLAKGDVQSLRSELLSVTALSALALLLFALHLSLPAAALLSPVLPAPLALLLRAGALLLLLSSPALAGLCLGALPSLGRAGAGTCLPAALGSSVILLAYACIYAALL